MVIVLNKKLKKNKRRNLLTDIPASQAVDRIATQFEAYDNKASDWRELYSLSIQRGKAAPSPCILCY